jgi:SAM-dependent methyltransferase
MRSRNNLIDQCRKPTGWAGRFVLWTMNIRHSRVTDWGLKHVSIGRHDTILDVGCGGGRTVDKLATIAAEGKVYGVDFSEESVAASRRTNQRRIGMGSVEILQGSVSSLPFPEGMFDLVTAVETHIHWPDLPGDLREVLRVLKPGGKLVIIAEIYKGGNPENRTQRLAEKYEEMTGMTLLTAGQHRELFANAGYSDVQIIEEYDKGWICGIGSKPS